MRAQRSSSRGVSVGARELVCCAGASESGRGERKDWLTARANLRGRRNTLDAVCLRGASEPAFEPPGRVPSALDFCERSVARADRRLAWDRGVHRTDFHVQK